MALPEPLTEPLPQMDPIHLRRCWFRRLSRVEVGRLSAYDVECLFPNRQVSIPLGDLETARPICGSCQAAGVFRPDEE